MCDASKAPLPLDTDRHPMEEEASSDGAQSCSCVTTDTLPGRAEPPGGDHGAGAEHGNVSDRARREACQVRFQTGVSPSQGFCMN